MSNKNRSRFSTIISILITAIILALTGWVVANREYVRDQVSVWQYQPTEAMTAIVERSELSDTGMFYLYASQPEINTSTEFNANCSRQEAGSAILGCYAGGRIFIYDVENSQLDGIEEVTAAHEMLHAAWDRLDINERNEITELLEAQYKLVENDALKARMEYYERTEPGERANELHSIIATEVLELDPRLEEYYKTYFDARVKIVGLYAGYQQVFDTISTASKALLAEITAAAATLDEQSIDYNARASQLEQEAAALEARSRTIDRTNSQEVNAYNRDRALLIVRINQLDTLRQQIAADSVRYNAQVVEYNKLVIRSNQLTNSLDSTLTSAPALQ